MHLRTMSVDLGIRKNLKVFCADSIDLYSSQSYQALVMYEIAQYFFETWSKSPILIWISLQRIQDRHSKVAEIVYALIQI